MGAINAIFRRLRSLQNCCAILKPSLSSRAHSHSKASVGPPIVLQQLWLRGLASRLRSANRPGRTGSSASKSTGSDDNSTRIAIRSMTIAKAIREGNRVAVFTRNYKSHLDEAFRVSSAEPGRLIPSEPHCGGHRQPSCFNSIAHSTSTLPWSIPARLFSMPRSSSNPRLRAPRLWLGRQDDGPRAAYDGMSNQC